MLHTMITQRRLVRKIERQEWRLIHVHYAFYNNRRLIRKVLAADPELIELYDWNHDKWTDVLQIPEERVRQLTERLTSPVIKKRLISFSRHYPIVTIFSPEYPEILTHIPDPPIVLYLHGNPSLLTHTLSLSVVGTRKPSRLAEQIMKQILQPLLKKNLLIISGMAIGIDGMAHQLALEQNARTIAVLGSGFHHIYPKKHLSLYQRLTEQDLIISEYPPDFSPQKYYFPERNRLISGLSFGTLVVEAKERSGTMITVGQALEQGKQVFALPGSILTDTSSGCNQLIKEGAKLVQTSYDIWEELPIANK